MAIHSAKLVSDEIIKFYNHKSTRKGVELNYSNQWEATFRKRLTYGKYIQKILLNQSLSSNLIKLVLIKRKLIKLDVFFLI